MIVLPSMDNPCSAVTAGLNTEERNMALDQGPAGQQAVDYDVLIIGAGFGGMRMLRE